jgi:pimeloyl-ACP methyl ester carboxylesterase
MVGAHDLPEFLGSGRLLCKRVPRNRYVTVPEAAHIANIDNPAFVNDAIMRFLSCTTS